MRTYDRRDEGEIPMDHELAIAKATPRMMACASVWTAMLSYFALQTVIQSVF